MKILHIVRRFTQEAWGGIESHVLDLCQELTKLGHQNTILCTKALDSVPLERIPKAAKIRRLDYYYPIFPLDQKTKLSLDYIGGDPFVRELENNALSIKADIIHFHTLCRFAKQTLQLAKKHSIPSILTLHGGVANIPKSEIKKFKKTKKFKLHYGRFFDWQLPNIHKEVDTVFCLNRQDLEFSKKINSNSELITNAIRSDNFKVEKKTSFIKKYNIPINSKIILNVGRIEEQKNQFLLLQAFYELQEPFTHLLIIGPINQSEYYKEMKVFVKNKNLQNKVTIIPGLKKDDPDLIQAFKNSHVFVLCSTHEPFGIVVLEAWCAGLPVICTKTTGTSDLIKNKTNGILLEKHNTKELQAALQTMLADKKMREILIQNAQRSLADYEWPNVIKRIEKIYINLCINK